MIFCLYMLSYISLKIMMNSIKLYPLPNIPEINPGDDLVDIIYRNINDNQIQINDNDILVIAQKIISKSEDRYVDLRKVIVSEEASDLAKKLNKDRSLIQLIMNESKKIISTEKNVVIVEHKLGFINVNAGIDLSNIPNNKNMALLLPKDPSKSAEDIQKSLSIKLKKNVAIIITDSMTRPYRYGIVNFALSSSNIQSLIDLKGHKDMYGKTLKATEIAVADELACSAGMLMGQSNEMNPVVVINGFDNKGFKDNIDAIDLVVNEKNDLYRS